MRAPKALGIVLFTAVAGLGAAAPARADVQITIHNGRVSLVAKDATLRQILTEWAKVGQTTIVNSERVPGGPLTLQLTDVPEAEALDTLLRALSGYVATPRATPFAGLSLFDRIVVTPKVAAPVSGAESSTARSRFAQPIYPGIGLTEQDAPPVLSVREDFPADDEVNWNRGPQSVPPPSPVPFVRKDYPADDEVNWSVPEPEPPPVPFAREDFPANDEVNWNPPLASGGVPRPSSTPERPSGRSGVPAASDNPGMPTAPAGAAVPGMPTPAAVPRQPMPPDEVVP